jgi:NADH dehydrogenase
VPPNEKQDGFTQIHFELGGELTSQALEGSDALVHVAYDFSAVRWSDIMRVNVEGSRRLLATARRAGVDRIVLVSTIAAFPETRSLYGRAKLEIERAAMDVGAAVIRPGLVWGPQSEAMFGTLQRIVKRLPVVPLLAPRNLRLALVHEDDLVVLVERLLGRWPDGSEQLFVAASEHTPEFVELLTSLAQSTDRRPRFVRLPWRTAWLGLRAIETVGAKPPFRSDGLLGLVYADSNPWARATACTESYGVRFRPYAPA